jgi:hypothetical protein
VSPSEATGDKGGIIPLWSAAATPLPPYEGLQSRPERRGGDKGGSLYRSFSRHGKYSAGGSVPTHTSWVQELELPAASRAVQVMAVRPTG